MRGALFSRVPLLLTSIVVCPLFHMNRLREPPDTKTRSESARLSPIAGTPTMQMIEA